MKRIRNMALTALMLFILVFTAACGAKAPEKIELKSAAYILGAAGETLDLSDEIEITGDAGAGLKYKTSDSSVALISDEGVVTAKSFGTAAITVTAAGNKNIKASAELLVYPYRGVYAAEKYIDAMSCDIRVRISLNSDGTFDYFRYPMNVAINGGGQMPSLSDKGTYKQKNGEIVLSGEYLGEFSMTFKLDSGNAVLSGNVPTGGAKTQLQMPLYVSEDRGEGGVYSGRGETENGVVIDYRLNLDAGSYELKIGTGADAASVSSGSYAFNGNTVEFCAITGVSFTAEYKSEKNVIEGMKIPYSADAEDSFAPATLTKE